MRIVHIITGLDTGGAEMMLYKLLSGMSANKYKQDVISLTKNGKVGKKIESLGINVTAINMRCSASGLKSIVQIIKILREINPDVIQTWMYHSDLLGGLAARIIGIPVIWNIRQSNLDRRSSKLTTRLVARICALLSYAVPTRILCCSNQAKYIHETLGYKRGKIVVIPNGFDLRLFKPDANERSSVRNELGLSGNSMLVGLVARFDPQKDHKAFIMAAGEVAKQRDNAHFILVGAGNDVFNKKLLEWINKAGIKECCHLLGMREDIPRLTAAFDIAVSASSYGEGFSNTIGEAMACGVPCLVTEVGDSSLIVGDTGIEVPSGSYVALTEGMKSLIDMGEEGRNKLGRAARQRIKENYSLPVVVRRYESFYKDTLDSCVV